MPKISVVIPTLNEEKAISEVVSNIPKKQTAANYRGGQWVQRWHCEKCNGRRRPGNS